MGRIYRKTNSQKRNPGSVLFLVLVFFPLLIIYGCSNRAALNEVRALVVDDNRIAEDHNQISREWLAELHNAGLIYHDSQARWIVDRILNRLLPHAERYGIKVVLARLPGENAMALPDGTLVLHQSMLAALDTEEQLAFLLAHEIAHRLMSHAWQSELHYAALLHNRDLRTTALSDNAFDRKQEIQADQYAIRLLENANYDLVRAAGFFSQMAKYPVALAGHSAQRTHPLLAERKQMVLTQASMQPNLLLRTSGQAQTRTELPDSSEQRALGRFAIDRKRYQQFRHSQLLTSIEHKRGEPDWQGALVQLVELESMSGRTVQSACLRANIYMGIASDMAESNKALVEIIRRPVDTALAARHSVRMSVGAAVGESRPGISGAQDYFYQQAENLLHATLRHSSEANCAREALALLSVK